MPSKAVAIIQYMFGANEPLLQAPVSAAGPWQGVNRLHAAWEPLLLSYIQALKGC